MSDIVSFAAMRKGAVPKMRIGLLRLSDSAPAIAAHEFGFFADEGVDVDLVMEPSWANIADKLAFGMIDAAVILPPLALAVQLGLRGASQSIIIPCAISTGGNSITLASPLAQETKARSHRENIPIVEALAACLRERDATIGVVHTYSTHNLLLRYWLATAGIRPGTGVALAVVPPTRAVEALASGQIAGFCAGAPWGEVARRAGVGSTIATSRDVWQNAPEKALAVRARWAEEHPEPLAGVIRALLRAAKFCDDPQNASYVGALLSRRKYLDVDSHHILAGLPGGTEIGAASSFYQSATTFPWRSHGLWFLNQMRRWDLVDQDLDLPALAIEVYRPDIYRAAVAPLGEPAPALEWKIEGAHDRAWTIDGTTGPVTMQPDLFCDRSQFDPDTVSFAQKSGAMHNL